MKRIYIYKRFERFWHWCQSSLILFLALTGFEVHGSIRVFGFEHAVFFHRTAAWMLMVLIVFAIFWHFATGEWKQYIPTTKLLREQIHYYTKGMFKGKKHPGHKNELSKLNPIQRFVYLGFKLILIPVTVISGLLYLLHKSFDKNNVIVIKDISLDGIAFWHTLGAMLILVFLIVHVYMATTGKTPGSNIRAMITGYEELNDVESEFENKKRSANEK